MGTVKAILNLVKCYINQGFMVLWGTSNNITASFLFLLMNIEILGTSACTQSYHLPITGTYFFQKIPNSYYRSI